MDHRIDKRQAFPLTPLFPDLNLAYALYLLHAPYEFWGRRTFPNSYSEKGHMINWTIFATISFSGCDFCIYPLAFHVQPLLHSPS